MRIYDISLPISESLIVWPNDPPIRISHLRHLARGDSVTTSLVTLGVHTGTHVDAPAHFIMGGATVEKLDLKALIGPALVIDALSKDTLSAAVLEKLPIPPGCRRLLFKTRNSELWTREHSTFHEQYVAITEDGARWLVSHGAWLVGVDYLSVAPFKTPVGTHRVLLDAGIVVLEGINLSSVKPGEYYLICLPLKLVGCEGAPARAILVGD